MSVEKLCADVNAVTVDGVQPIHLACIFGHTDIVQILGNAGANVNAEIDKDMFYKYTNILNKEDMQWCSDFGDKMTLITYAIIFLYKKPDLIRILIDLKSNLKIKSIRNKTLLMYLIEYDLLAIAQDLICNEEYREFINIRDDDGFHAIDYILHPKKYGSYRYLGSKLNSWDTTAGDLVRCFLACDINLNATINQDPNTFLLNVVAYRSSPGMLRYLLPHYASITKSEALFNATLPLENPTNYFLPIPFTPTQPQLEMLQKQRIESIKLILKDLINRLSFGLPVPEEEKKLMDKLVSTNNYIKSTVDNYKQCFIDGILKNTIIPYGDNKITHYDFILQSIYDKKLQIFVRDKTFMKFQRKCFAFDIIFRETKFSESVNGIPPLKYYGDYYYFRQLLEKKIMIAYQRVKLLSELKKISHLQKAIPTPFELILDIVDNLNNKDLENFVSAFYLKFYLDYDYD